jgi:integral membrane protein (TIGR01906 family)
MKPAKLLTVLLSVLTALVLLTAAIAAPILCRPFYYAHIGPLELCQKTGLTEDQIKTAYNEMLDYCLGTDEFSTGVLAWSDSGKSHFTDVRGLFLLNLRVLAVSAVALVVLLILSHTRKWRSPPILGRSFRFWAGAGLGGLFLLIGGLAALDFDRAFVVFHSLFFPGKTNWVFNPNLDQIINILPETFFRNCAILILSILILGCAALIFSDFFHSKRPR